MSLIENYWKTFLWKIKLKKISENINFIKKEKKNFNPYQDNGGTVISVAGGNYCIIASDTRYSSGFSIPSRFQIKVIKISKKIILATSGMFADVIFFQRQIKNNVIKYQSTNNGKVFVDNCAFYISSVLYSKRFFPYYTFNILSGLCKKEKGSVYNFDAVGSFEKMKSSCTGAGQLLIQPLLDGHFNEKEENFFSDIKSIENVICSIKGFFLKAATRNVCIGDGLQLFVITKKGVLIENYFLKID